MPIDYLPRIKTFGALGYDAERIVSLLNLTGKERVEFLLKLQTPGDEYYLAYQNGFAIGEWNVDAGLAKQAEQGDIDSIEALAARSRERKLRDMKQQLFNI